MRTQKAIKRELAALARRRKNYQSAEEMSRSLLIARVLDWALGEFDVRPVDQLRFDMEVYEAGLKVGKQLSRKRAKAVSKATP